LSPAHDRLPAWTLLGLVPLAALGAIALWLRASWEQIPESFAVHWGLNGQPNRWGTRSFHGVFGALGFGAGMILLFLIFAIVMFYGSRRGPKRLGVLKIFVALSWLLGYIFSGVGLLPFFRPSPLLILLPTALFVIAVIWWSMRAFQMDP